MLILAEAGLVDFGRGMTVGTGSGVVSRSDIRL